MWSKDLLAQLGKYQLVLGSSSPRRSEILARNVGLPDFKIVTSTFEENLDKTGVSAEQYVISTAKHKIPSILDQLDPKKNAILVVADTVVACGEHILEKPGNCDAQMEMLAKYRENPDIRVITAVHVGIVYKGEIQSLVTGSEITHLIFDALISDEELRFYAESGEGHHVAGGFKYQESGCTLFTSLRGDYYNVVGLPARKTQELIKRALS